MTVDAQWEKWSGAQYNEPFDAWRLKGGARVFDDISIRADGMSALIHETEIVICDCGHTALAHHGLDARERRDAGCQTNAMRDDWCRCVKTCQMVMEEQ